ncbi:dirigent protein 24-like [Hibiscus syriacus]|uniref:dirigent protein 24-like n=1 Tax=Hibiscus syriacus TaxID=106335 RepID=UPI00192418C1|nr:dirigent protein 24-like [Hibiscus syriacus]
MTFDVTDNFSTKVWMMTKARGMGNDTLWGSKVSCTTDSYVTSTTRVHERIREIGVIEVESAIAISSPGVVAAATPTKPDPHEPSLSFFMHDILGGSHPSARVVTSVIVNSEINGIPFSNTNNDISPDDWGVTGGNIQSFNNLINPNNIPFLIGLISAQTNDVIQNTGKNDNILNFGIQHFVTVRQLPPETLQRLMFGTITVVDDEVIEPHELGTAVLGRTQGFYLASSLDHNSQAITLTIVLHGGEHETEDVTSFLRTMSPESQITMVCGTGKYEHAKGYATVETLLHQEDQHITDGVDTMLHFNVDLIE